MAAPAAAGLTGWQGRLRRRSGGAGRPAEAEVRRLRMGALGAKKLVGLADPVGNGVGRGAPWGRVQSAAGPCFGAGPWSGL